MTPITVDGIATEIKYNKLYIHCDNSFIKNKYKNESSEFKLPITYTGIYVKIPKDITRVDIFPLQELKDVLDKKVKVKLKYKRYKFRPNQNEDIIQGISLTLISIKIMS